MEVLGCVGEDISVIGGSCMSGGADCVIHYALSCVDGHKRLKLRRPCISGLKNGIIFDTRCAYRSGFNLVPRLVKLRCWLAGVA